MKYGCPKCKQVDSIFELNEVLVEYAVTEFDEEGQPENYGESTVMWETAAVVDSDRFSRYRCANCEEEFDELVQLPEVEVK